MKLVIQILSPHLDDAALSCADHIGTWRASGHRVKVTTLFTDFGETEPSPYMRRFMVEQGCPDSTHYEEIRRREDREAMKKMGVEFAHASFRDAAFRESGGQRVYSDYGALTSGRIASEDAMVLEEIRGLFRKFPLSDLIIIPLGIGRHVDHLIVREVARQIWQDRAQVGFYFDQPYARNPLKYSPSIFPLFANQSISLKFVSDWKVDVLSAYATQMPYLYRGRPCFPEILLLPTRIADRIPQEHERELVPAPVS